MSMLTLIIAALAVWEIIEIWLHSSLTAGLRARVELWENHLGALVRCPFCLSPWVSLLVVALLAMSEHLAHDGPRWPGLLIAVPIWSLAVARLANLGNDFFRSSSRTPRYDVLSDEEA